MGHMAVFYVFTAWITRPMEQRNGNPPQKRSYTKVPCFHVFGSVIAVIAVVRLELADV